MHHVMLSYLNPELTIWNHRFQKNPFEINPHAVEKVAAHLNQKRRLWKISSDELIESTKKFLDEHKTEAEAGYCEPFYSGLLK